MPIWHLMTWKLIRCSRSLWNPQSQSHAWHACAMHVPSKPFYLMFGIPHSHVRTRMLRSPRLLSQALVGFSFISFAGFLEDVPGHIIPKHMQYASGPIWNTFLKSLQTKFCLSIYVAPLARHGNKQGISNSGYVDLGTNVTSSNSEKVTPIEDVLQPMPASGKTCKYVLASVFLETSLPWMTESSLK